MSENRFSEQKYAAGDMPTFLAGHRVPAGTYRQVGTQQEVQMDQDDILPATCDGHVAVYERRGSLGWHSHP